MIQRFSSLTSLFSLRKSRSRHKDGSLDLELCFFVLKDISRDENMIRLCPSLNKK